MMTPEQARDALSSFPDADTALKEAVKRVPKAEREIGLRIAGLDANGKKLSFIQDDWRAADRLIRKSRIEAGRKVESLPVKKRLSLWKAFFPKLDSDLIERAWESLRSAPYQSGYEARPFRVPNLPDAGLDRRFEWLSDFAVGLSRFDPSLEWLAAWAPHIAATEGYTYSAQTWPIFAAAIDLGGKRSESIVRILKDSAQGVHEVGAMGRHVIRAFLSSSNPDCWDYMEKMLLAAQREEGLRQSILTDLDDANPTAFLRMLKLIREHDLTRFSSVARALDVWLGLAWDSESVKIINSTIDRLIACLDDSQAIERAVKSGSGEDLYIALWALAFEDAEVAASRAGSFLADPSAERRYAAVHLLTRLSQDQLTLPDLAKALGDSDLRVAENANDAFCGYGTVGVDLEARETSDLFERAEAFAARLPEKPKPADPILWPWRVHRLDRSGAHKTMIEYLGKRSVHRLIKHFDAMSPDNRHSALKKVVEADTTDAAVRRFVVGCAGDAATWVREEAIKALAKSRIESEEALALESLLTRKTKDLREGVVTLLVGQTDDQVLASADRLLNQRKIESRKAGLEILRRMCEAGRAAVACRERAAAYREAQPNLDADETTQLAAVLESGRKVASLEDGLGLFDPSQKTKPPQAVAREFVWISEAAYECLRSLTDLIDRNKQVVVPKEKFGRFGATEDKFLGSLDRWDFPAPIDWSHKTVDFERLPLRELWEEWWNSRSDKLRDADGLELLRLRNLLLAAGGPADDDDDDDDDEDESKKAGGEKPAMPPRESIPPKLLVRIGKELGKKGLAGLPYAETVANVVEWLIALHPAEKAPDFLLDAAETFFTRFSKEALAYQYKTRYSERMHDFRDAATDFNAIYSEIDVLSDFMPAVWRPEHDRRLFEIMRRRDEPGTAIGRARPSAECVFAARLAGAASEADLYDHLIGPEPDLPMLQSLLRRKPGDWSLKLPELGPIAERIRTRIMEVELERGQAVTAASVPACRIGYLPGMNYFWKIADALGKETLPKVGYYWGSNPSRAEVFAHLLRVCFPAPTDTVEDFVREWKSRSLPESRLVELAVFSPQWATRAEQALGWPGFEDAVWWFHAHTKGSDWTIDQEIRDVWKAEIASRTPLSPEDLIDGAVDVDWFRRVWDTLGKERWAVLDQAAKYTSSGNGHIRARLFASAMSGELKKPELLERIDPKRQPDAVRALGLLPLAEGSARDGDVLDRYRKIQEFVRTSKQFGSQRQATEKRAAAIGLDNLARTAGFADPIRLEWAMEAEAVADLARGPVVVEVDDVTVALALDLDGQPDVTVTKAGKPLKSVPPKIKKDPRVEELFDRKTDIKRQASRVRKSLEAAMCRGDSFTGAELAELAGHAVLWPVLSKLVLIGEGIAGYPVAGGKGLSDHTGKVEPVKRAEKIRIAHSHDLMKLGDWHQWQKECFRSERVQPFKQIFRELYVLTQSEKTDGDRSLRYAGHQVNPSQAIALLGGREWVNHPEEGVRRTFHESGITASIDVLGLTFSPADVEGVTIESVQFQSRKDMRRIKLEDVPPLIFSEVMRDVDLVVSVAHRGGIDPEASASTVEMRANLLGETCSLLGLKNVTIKKSHALIVGKLGEYSLHLGSGSVHRMPGGYVCIVPVHAQHRGRLFLPFADDDPRTAEVITKTILLARDDEIKDPSILEQLRAVH